MPSCVPRAAERTVLFLTSPGLWGLWPFLPLIRRSGGREELGVAFDARAAGLTGYSSTVFLTNVFTLPDDLTAFLNLPREAFDTADEVVAAGWGVD